MEDTVQVKSTSVVRLHVEDTAVSAQQRQRRTRWARAAISSASSRLNSIGKLLRARLPSSGMLGPWPIFVMLNSHLSKGRHGLGFYCTYTISTGKCKHKIEINEYHMHNLNIHTN